MTCSLAGCGIEEPRDVGSKKQAVLTGNGSACENSRVVFLRDADGDIACSGVVLRSDLILTAGHCAFDKNGDLHGHLSTLTVGSGAAGCTHGSAAISSALRHPKYLPPTSDYAAYDIAVLKLDQALPNVTPVTLGGSSVGGEIVASAFGAGSSGQTCMSGTVTFYGPTPDGAVEIIADLGKDSICEGDSGGGVFHAKSGELVGIVVGMVNNVACDSMAIFTADWGFVRGAISSMAGAVSVGCTSGSSRSCLVAGESCPDTSDDCRFGVSTCRSDGTWSTCAMSTTRVWDADSQRCVCTNTCSGNTRQDPDSCLCIDLCGDGSCLGEETHQSCPADCPDLCGDGTCAFWQGETLSNCPQDCSACGDGLCTGPETLLSCPSDCGSCGDGYCASNESAFTCPSDCNTTSGGGSGGGSTGGSGDDTTDVCANPQDPFWADVFGEYAFEAYLFYCGVDA